MTQRSAFVLSPVTEPDVRELMTWFPDAASTQLWGGPAFRFPFTYDTFIADTRWPGMASRCLRDGKELLGFGQFYDRFHRINLARIVVRPAYRGQGMGRRFLQALMKEAAEAMECAGFSLFVYRDNEIAIRCYRALGFRTAEFPPDAPLQDVTYYMTRSAQYNAGS
jgi:ribosomal protein S18 acetylase RimI-like enzyme